MGPGVQSNREDFEELRFFVYNIFDIDKGKYMDAPTRRQLTEFLKLEHVPVFEESMDLSGIKKIEELLSMANQPSLKNPVAEGLVFKSIDNPDISFKVISNEFLLNLKEEETKNKIRKSNEQKLKKNESNNRSIKNSNDDTGRY